MDGFECGLLGFAIGLIVYRLLLILALDSFAPTICSFCKQKSRRGRK